MFQTVILAGGEGTRLRPLTCDLPKPMAPLCGRPAMDYILDLLERHSAKEVFVTLGYRPQAITGYYTDRPRTGMDLRFVEEDHPLGTAGSVKNACPNIEDPLLVISGDALCDFDLTAALAFHRSRNADATLLVKRVEDPREYGLVLAGEDGRIGGFVEKPSFGQAVTDLANTGIYIVSPRALSMIPTGENTDFAKDLFPVMLRTGMALYAYEDLGYWCDIGDLDSYRLCQKELMAGLCACRPLGMELERGIYLKETMPAGAFTLLPPVYLGENVTIGPGAVIGPGTVVGDSCRIGAGARVEDSILHDGAFVGEGAHLSGAILCQGASAEAKAVLEEGAVLGAHATVGRGASLRAKVWPGRRVEAGETLSADRKKGHPGWASFGEQGLCGEIGVEITPEFCARFGAAVATAAKGEPVALCGGDFPGGEPLLDALASGLRSAGSDVADFGKGVLGFLSYGMQFCALSWGVYLGGGKGVSLRLVTSGGLPATRPMERSVEKALTGELARRSGDSFGRRETLAGLQGFYQGELKKLAPQGLGGLSARVQAQSPGAQRLLEDPLRQLGCGLSGGPILLLDSSGEHLTILEEEWGAIPAYRALALCCEEAFACGETVSLPFEAPRALDDLAKERDGHLLRYLCCPADDSDRKARQSARDCLWPRDGMMQALLLLARQKRTGEDFFQMVLGLPSFELVSRQVATKGSPARLMQRLGPVEGMVEGVTLSLKGGRVLAQPDRRGRGIRLYAEAVNAEAAAELCEDVARRIAALSEED